MFFQILAIEVIEFVKSKRSKRTGLPIEIRFSSEDSFRSNLADLLTIYDAVNRVGVNRVGIADTVGWQVYLFVTFHVVGPKILAGLLILVDVKVPMLTN